MARPARIPLSEEATTRERILRVASELFAEKGYGATSMRDVAHAAGIQVSTLYHHCRSKNDLYREVTERTETQIRAIVDEALSGGRDFATLSRRAIERLFDFYLGNRHLAKLALRATLGDRVEHPDRGTRRWVGFMEEVMRQRGAPRSFAGLDPALLLITFEGILTYHLLARDSYHTLFGKDVTDPEMARRTKDHVINVVLRILGIEPVSGGEREATEGGRRTWDSKTTWARGRSKRC